MVQYKVYVDKKYLVKAGTRTCDEPWDSLIYNRWWQPIISGITFSKQKRKMDVKILSNISHQNLTVKRFSTQWGVRTRKSTFSNYSAVKSRKKRRTENFEAGNSWREKLESDEKRGRKSKVFSSVERRRRWWDWLWGGGGSSV